MEVRKVSSSKVDLQGHFCCLNVIGTDFIPQITFDFLLASIATVSILYRFRDFISYFPKFKVPLEVIYHACTNTRQYQSAIPNSKYLASKHTMVTP